MALELDPHAARGFSDFRQLCSQFGIIDDLFDVPNLVGPLLKAGSCERSPGASFAALVESAGAGFLTTLTVLRRLTTQPRL